MLNNIRTSQKIGPQSESGFTLIMVLAVLSVLTLIGLSFVYVMRTEEKAAGNFLSGYKASRLARNGIAQAVSNLEAGRYDKLDQLVQYTGYETVKAASVNNTQVGNDKPEVNVQDEEGKFNLGAALDYNSRGRWPGLNLGGFVVYHFEKAGLSYADATSAIVKMSQARKNDVLRSIEDLEVIIGKKQADILSNYITFYSFDANKNSEETPRVNVNQAAAKDLYSVLLQEMPKGLAAQLAVNLVDYRDADSIPTVLVIDNVMYRGVEINPVINEVMPCPGFTDSESSRQDGNYIELYNPYPMEISVEGWKLEGRFGSVVLSGAIPSEGYLMVTDHYNPDSDWDESDGKRQSYRLLFGNVPASHLVEDDQLILSKKGDTIKLYDDEENLVDIFKYGVTSQNKAWERNDPRVDRVWAVNNGSPYAKNKVYAPPMKTVDEENLTRVADASFKSIGDIGYVSLATPSTAWAVVSWDKSAGISYGRILDCLKVNGEVENKGSININTAPVEVLIGLPYMTQDLAKAIVTYRQKYGSFKTTADLLKVPGMTIPIAVSTEADSNQGELELYLANFTHIANWVTVRSYNFTITSHAKLTHQNKIIAEKTVQSLISMVGSKPETIYEKELLP